MKWSEMKAAIDEQISAKGWKDADIEWIDWSEGSSMEHGPEIGGKEVDSFIQ